MRGPNCRVETWEQVLDDLRAQAEIEHNKEEAPERLELEKKKPKMNGFDVNATVDDFITPRPATYALNKLESFEYVEYGISLKKGC